MNEKISTQAGRSQLGEIAPEFAHLNDDILFGEVWNEPQLDTKTRCIVTVVSLVCQGITDSSLIHHLENAKKHGVTLSEIAAILTHNAFYAGWPKAWAAFRLVKDVWKEETGHLSEQEAYQKTIDFPIGAENVAYAEYFDGKSYTYPVCKSPRLNQITFEPGCTNHWHIHHAAKGGGQLLICNGGTGYYQEWGQEPLKMEKGDVVLIPANVKHWHGAAPNAWFSHLAMGLPGEEVSTQWLEPVDMEAYEKLSS